MYNDVPADREVWKRLWEEGEGDGGQFLDNPPKGLWVRYETSADWMGYPIGTVNPGEEGPQFEYAVCPINKVVDVFRAEIDLAAAKWNLLRRKTKDVQGVDIGDPELLFVHDFQ
jgi:hypothetical protein